MRKVTASYQWKLWDVWRNELYTQESKKIPLCAPIYMIYGTLFSSKKNSTGNSHTNKGFARSLGKLDRSEFMPPSIVACHYILHFMKSEEPATSPSKYKGSGRKWQGSQGDNFQIATISSVAIYIDVVLSIMTERGFLNLKYMLDTGREETEALEKGRSKW